MARTTLLTSALALTLAAAPAAALAQDSGAASAGGQSGNTRAQDLTCAQLTAMDTATVPGVLYFISGYGAGQQDGAGMAADGGMDDSDSADADAPQESGNAAQQAASESNGAGAEDSDMAEGDQAGAMGEANLARVTGFFEIPVERLVVACEEAPDQRVSDMISQEAQNYADDVSSDGAEAPGGNASVDEGGQSQSMDSDDAEANQQAEPEVEESTPEQAEQDSAGQDSDAGMDPNAEAEPEVEESTPEQGEGESAN